MKDQKPSVPLLKRMKTIETEIKTTPPVGISLARLMEMKTDKLPTLAEPVLPQSGIVALYGSSDTGKSALARQLVMAVTAGETEFLGFPLHTRHRRAVYVSTEDDEIALSYLFGRQREGTGRPATDYARAIVLTDPADLTESLARLLAHLPADLVVIDTFADLFAGDSHRANEVRTFLRGFADIARQNDLLVLFLHHTVKGAENLPPSKNNVMGSQGFESRMRMTMELRNDPYDPQFKHLCITKGNYLPREEKQSGYVLRMDSHLLFHQTGRRTPFEEIVLQGQRPDQAGAGREEIDWRRLFHGAETLKTAEIADRLEMIYRMRLSTAERRIRECLVRVSRGVWRLPSTA